MRPDRGIASDSNHARAARRDRGIHKLTRVRHHARQRTRRHRPPTPLAPGSARGARYPNKRTNGRIHTPTHPGCAPTPTNTTYPKSNPQPCHHSDTTPNKKPAPLRAGHQSSFTSANRAGLCEAGPRHRLGLKPPPRCPSRSGHPQTHAGPSPRPSTGMARPTAVVTSIDVAVIPLRSRHRTVARGMFPQVLDVVSLRPIRTPLFVHLMLTRGLRPLIHTIARHSILLCRSLAALTRQASLLSDSPISTNTN